MAIAFVAAWPGSVNIVASGTTNAMTSRTPASGELIVGAVACGNGLLTSVTDGSGQTYTVLPAFGPAGGTRNCSVYVYYLQNTTNVGHAPTANFSSATFSSHICGSFTGCATGTPYDFNCTTSGTGSSTSLASGNMPQATSFPNEVVLGFGVADTNNTTATWSAQQIGGVGASGYGNSSNGGNAPPIAGAFKIESVSAVYNYTETNAVSSNWVAIILSFADTNVAIAQNLMPWQNQGQMGAIIAG